MLGDILERRRVQAHVGSGERLARRRERTDLTTAQRWARRLLLDELEVYWRAGRFPKNTVSDELTPVFVDPAGTHCAIAHLMVAGGAGALAREIASTRNYSFVPELASDPRVASWLEAAGFDVDEAARIQPSYCPDSPRTCVCQGAGSSRYAAVARGRSVGERQISITESSGKGEGPCSEVRVGDVVELAGQTRYAEYMVSLQSSRTSSGKPTCTASPIFAIDGAGAAFCEQWAGSGALPRPLSASETLALVSSSDCASWLALDSDEWAEQPSCGGCAIAPSDATAGPADLSTFAIVTSVLAYRVARRARNWRRSP